ncbi:uncharacterized protein LOC133829567 [Humulus lupulus]|uniref:uncharacterized protein LOC133829567 n=1 Tax=Humulus lupulus TaxID=3486 RepID=UPI002B40D695|nr:uncharacterized protein LOC133829567 [Humulus lupulus]
MLIAQIASLTKQMQQQNNISGQVMQLQPALISCETCEGPYHFQQCPATSSYSVDDIPLKQVQAIGNFPRTKHEGPTVENKGKKIEDQHVPSLAQEEVIEDLPKKEKPKYTESIPKIPYPQRFRKENLDRKFSKFLERKIEDYETVALTEECSAIIQKKLPQKLRDPGSFTIPCTIENFHCERALCDLGASINLMPLSVFRRLGLGEARPITLTLQLANRSLTYPRGIIEDVLVKVEKFIFPADFIVLDMEEDEDVPIILGRPILATGQALIDVQKGELRLRVQGDEVVFNVFKALKYPRASDSCFSVNVIEEQL